MSSKLKRGRPGTEKFFKKHSEWERKKKYERLRDTSGGKNFRGR